jgi:hypothetical protein
MVPLVLKGKGKGYREIWNCKDYGLIVPLALEGKGKGPQSNLELQGPWTHGPASPGR